MSEVNVDKAVTYVAGYEWGPGVSKVIVSLSNSIENASKEGASIITGRKERKIQDVYLSNEKGDHVSGNSNHVTIELDVAFEPDGSISPFYYNMTTFQNEWVSKYVVKATFHATVDGKDTLISFEKDCINNRICPDTEQFAVRGTFSGRYKNQMTNQEDLLSIQYAAYEPKQLKDDNAKNPLIIWIHGQGEGGTDADIALLGNQVTALAKPKIQSYFTTKNGANGAYVLVPQCKTYWMDGGDGVNSNGDVVSRYTYILMDTIKEYLSKNTDVDTNRIYIGGCSNGGYMTMNMIITFPDVWAATYAICEGYPYMIFKRDENGKYIPEKDAKSPTEIVQSDQRWFTPEKLEAIKNIPIWIIQSADDPIVSSRRFSFPKYKELLKAGAKNCWYSLFETVERVDIPGMRYFGHWSWIRLFNDQVTTVQEREKIMSSNDPVNYGFVPSNQGGGCQKASDEKGTYESIFAWLNAQVKPQ